jgi:hypothetical protein
MKSKIIDPFTTSFIKKLSHRHRKNAYDCYDMAARMPKSSTTKALILSDGTTFLEFSTIYAAINICVDAINSLGAALEGLPDREEFDSVKEELREQRKKVKESLEPIKKEYDNLQEQRKRSANIYG